MIYLEWICRIDDNIQDIERRPGEEEEEGDESEENVRPLPSADLPHHAAGEAASQHPLSGDAEGPGHHDVGHGDNAERDNVLENQPGQDIRHAGGGRGPGLKIYRIEEN